MSDARSCSNHCHTFDDYNGGQWMHEGGDRKWHGERRSYCWRSRQELMVVDGQPHIVDMLKLPTRTSTPEAVAEALAAVLEAAGYPAHGQRLQHSEGTGVVEGYDWGKEDDDTAYINVFLCNDDPNEGQLPGFESMDGEEARRAERVADTYPEARVRQTGAVG